MKILLLAQHYHPFIGGIETQARLAAQALAETEDVRVAAVNFTTSHWPVRLAPLHNHLLAAPFASYQDGLVPVHSLSPNGWDRIRLAPIAVQAIPGVRRVADAAVRAFGYQCHRQVFRPKLRELMQGMDVVHSVAIDYLGWAALEVAKELGIPFVCTPHVHPHQWGDDLENVQFYRQCDAVVALLETDRQYLISLGVSPERIRVIGGCPILPPTADPTGFRYRHQLGNLPLILFVGRICTYKGVKAMLAATDLVWKQIPEAQFVFIGPPTQESQQWFESTDQRVLYLGKVSDQEKADALAACDLFCMPSLGEIMPGVYLEAWSYGKPVIGGKANGLPELIEGNAAGVTVEQDPQRISQVLIEVLTDPMIRQQWGQNGQALVNRHYALPIVIEQRKALYGSLISTQ